MDISLDLSLTDSHVLITGGAGLIGESVVHHFVTAGAKVSSLDITYAPGPPFTASSPKGQYQCIHCDISSEASVARAFSDAASSFGPVEVCIALASLDYSVLEHAQITEASFAQMKRVLDVNVAGTWLTAREWLRGLKSAASQHPKPALKNVSLVIIGSESGRFGERFNADYSMAKSAVQGGLLQSLKAEAPRVWEGARVNAVAPGAVDTERWRQECREDPRLEWAETMATTALKKAVPTPAIAKAILFLASENFSGNVHGQVVNVDSGKTGKVMWMPEEA
jgi:NAD(P)-dependent dehydrogenase (short-subunit alcohol dehydrogenase family)